MPTLRLQGRVPLLIALGASQCLLGGHALAQTRIAMLHGLKSDPSTWQTAEARLNAVYGSRITVVRPTLPSLNAYESQAGTFVSNNPTLPTSTILIGHSNGGIVSRSSVRLRGAQGIITVGSPHQGAALITNTGSALAWLGTVVNSIRDPISRYNNWDNNTSNWFDASVAGYLADVAIVTVAGHLNNWLTGLTVPLVSDMAPGSGYAATSLNTGTSLAAENAMMDIRRVGIATLVPPYGIMCSLPGGSQSGCFNTWEAAGNAFAALFASYASLPWDANDVWWWAKVSNAWRWQAGATYLWNIDYRWCELIGAQPLGTGCDSDGVVPLSSQLYPTQFSIVLSQYGIPHTQQTGSSQVHTSILDALVLRSFSIP